MVKTPKDCTILVVEDELPLARAIQTKLEKSGFGVVTARRVDQALNLMEDLDRVDLIWLDHYLLGKDTGLEFVRQIKESDTWKNTPIYLVTNTATKGKLHTYMRLGVDKYFIKASTRLDDVINQITSEVCVIK